MNPSRALPDQQRGGALLPGSPSRLYLQCQSPPEPNPAFHPSIRATNQTRHRSEQETEQPAEQTQGIISFPSMEASKFRFGRDMPPAFKFDPTDADIVAHYLLPRALNLPNPYEQAIIDEDPGSAPPWEMLRRHGGVDHAFFFGPPTDLSHNGGRKNRNVGGGVWQGQKAVEGTVTLLRPGGGEADIKYKRYDLSFCRTKRGRTTGYVMHEYEILSPPLPGTVLTRIKAPRSDKRQQVVPDPEQAGPSHEYDATAMIGYGEGCSGGQDGALYSGGMVKKARYDDSNYCAPMHDQPGASYNYDAAAMNGGGFTGEQAPAFYGGGMVDTSGADYDPSGYVPECGGDYSYGEYQQWRYQQDMGNQYQAGHDAVMCTGSEGFSGEYQQWQYQQDPSSQYQAGDQGSGLCGEEQAGALCGNSNSDSGSVVGTETSAHSTISLCGDGEVECDDASFYNLFFGDDDDLNCEQNGAGDPAN